MPWFLVWTLLVVAGLALIGWLVWRVVRSGAALARELAEASERVAALSAQVERLQEATRREPELAVFDDPVRLRRERDRRDRERRRARARAARRRALSR